MRAPHLYVLSVTLALTLAPAAFAQEALAGKLDRIVPSYSLTKTGFGSADRITGPGTVYTVHIDGLLARAIANHVTPTNTITDGQLLPPAKGFRAAFGASGDVQQVQPGQRFYLHDIQAKDDALVFTLLSLGSVDVVNDGTSAHSRVRMYLRFPLSKEQMAQLSPDSVHALTDPVFLPENAPVKTASVQLGQSGADVHRALGEPDQQIDLGPKQILIYKSVKITLVDGKVTDAQ